MTASIQSVTEAPASSAPAAAAREPQREMFLKLLVAQIRNQNPLNPADGIEFLTQLAQFSELEQMMGIRTELEIIRKGLAGQPAGDSTGGQQ